MKLKKIVSLALAGILAVSMLTACGEGSSSSSTPTPNEPTTSSPVSAFEKAIAGENATLTITVSENAKLAEVVAKYNENYHHEMTSVDGYTDGLTKVVETVFGTGAATMDDNDSVIAAVNGRTVKKGTKYLYAIYANGVITSDACRTQAANDMANRLSGVTNVFMGTDGSAGWGKDTELNNTYTLYVYEGSVMDNAGKTVPYVISVLKVETNQRVEK